MSDISNQLIKDSYNYVLQSDLSTGIVYRVGGGIPVNPKFLSGLTINNSFNYSDGTEQPGYVLITDAFGNATWGPISGSSSGDYLPLSGGTVTGATIFTSGLTANTFSASTYLGLPIDIRVTGATKSGSVATFRNNTGGTFTLTGLTDTFVTGATKSGSVATFTNNTGGTFTLTGLTDTFVTGGTHSLTGGTTTFRNNTGGTFSVSGYFTPSNDIYVTSGQVDHGPSTENNILTLLRNNASAVTINNLVDISEVTKSEMDTLISNGEVIKGKTYKIFGCDTSLYYNGRDKRDNDVYTTIYLMGLENDKLTETGVGIFYTPKYDAYPIFTNEQFYSADNNVIWGGFVWTCKVEGTYNSIDIFTLDPSFSVIFPLKDGNLTDEYNIRYDDIIYDYENDRIIYRNENDTNIVQTNVENISYWTNTMSLYNPIKAFQWGNVYNGTNGIGNQRIINSYNENINYKGLYQTNFYFDNLSYQNDVFVGGDGCYQTNFHFENKSYQSNIIFDEVSYQQNFSFNNESYQSNITFLTTESVPYQEYFNFNNGSYQSSVDVVNSTQSYFEFDNGSYQSSIVSNRPQTNFIFDDGSQYNSTGSVTQENVTIKGFSRDVSGLSSVENGVYFIHDLPIKTTSKLIGKINNELIEVDNLSYDGSKWVLDGTIHVNTISATTYDNLPTDVFVTGGTYTSGDAIFTNNTGGTFTVSGFAVGSGGGQLFYLNLSQSEGSNRLLSTTASTSPQQTSGVTISSGVTGTIASFQSPQLNTILIPGGVWSFHLHSYKEDSNASFDIFVEVYKRTSGGTQTLLFQTEPTTVITNFPLPSMQITESYFSGASLVVSDSIVTIVKATNTGNQTKIITLVTEGATYYSYVVSSLPTQQGLTCDTLSGCSIIQTIQTNISNKLDKSGGTITGDLIVNSGLTANTISATTYNNLINSLEIFNRTQGIYYFDDFMGSLITGFNNTTNGIVTNVGNQQGTVRSTSAITNRTNQQGVVEALTSANATGTAGYYYANGVYKGSGAISIETYINFTTLSVLGERFLSLFGFYTGQNYLNPPNFIVITYDEGGSLVFENPSPNFKCVSRSASGTRTTTITSIPVVAGQWYRLRINISNDGGTVTFFIDNTLVGTHSTNIPTNATFLPVGCMLQKTSGVAARAMQTDYFMYKEIFTTAR